jgi:hypothetical protein
MHCGRSATTAVGGEDGRLASEAGVSGVSGNGGGRGVRMQELYDLAWLCAHQSPERLRWFAVMWDCLSNGSVEIWAKRLLAKDLGDAWYLDRQFDRISDDDLKQLLAERSNYITAFLGVTRVRSYGKKSSFEPLRSRAFSPRSVRCLSCGDSTEPVEVPREIVSEAR